jgi:hypothetical protein
VRKSTNLGDGAVGKKQSRAPPRPCRLTPSPSRCPPQAVQPGAHLRRLRGGGGGRHPRLY